MGRQKELHDAKAGFGAHGGKHVGVPSDLVEIWFETGGGLHISMIAEIWNHVKPRNDSHDAPFSFRGRRQPHQMKKKSVTRSKQVGRA